MTPTGHRVETEHFSTSEVHILNRGINPRFEELGAIRRGIGAERSKRSRGSLIPQRGMRRLVFVFPWEGLEFVVIVSPLISMVSLRNFLKQLKGVLCNI